MSRRTMTERTAALRAATRHDRLRWVREIERLDPHTDHAQIYRITVAHEFPWDINQALSFALFRTYAVPSVGDLLARTGEFSTRTQKRYDDTVLILDAILEHGIASRPGRDAVRRMNQMHRAYDISNADLRYVLSTFVTVPIRWLRDYGWRPMTEAEKVASAQVYREIGRHLGITDIPETYQDFAALMDGYEREHFAFDAGGREVADATLALLLTFHPRLAAPLVDVFSRCLMDPPLRTALGYRDPPRAAELASTSLMKLRARVERLLPPRIEPKFGRQLPTVRSYPLGYQVSELGTFPAGPVPAGPPGD